MKSWKPGLSWGSISVFEKTVSEALKAGCRVIVAGGYRNDDLPELLGDFSTSANIIFHESRGWQKGMDETVRSALSEVSSEYFFIVPVDMPLITSEVYTRLANLAGDGKTQYPVYRPTYAGKPGHPVLMNREASDALRSAVPGTPIREILKEFKTYSESWKDDCVIRDLDTVEDYERLKPAADS